MNFLLALTPVIIVLIGIVVLKKPALYVAPISLIYTIIISYLFFDAKTSMVAAQAYSGFIEGFKIILLIFSAFIILTMMTGTGAIENIKEVIANITDDKRAQLIIIAIMFSIFLEGAAGAGSPAAIAAPFLVGLGFDPVLSSMAALLGDSTPGAWGGAGVTTIMGSQTFTDAGVITTAEASGMTGFFNSFGLFIIPIMVTLLVFGKKGLKNFWPFIIFSSGVLCGLMLFFSNIVGPELTSLGTGILSIIFTVIFLKFYKIKTPDEFKYKREESKINNNFKTIQAFGPYLVLVILLPLVRYTFPWEVLTKFGYIVWVDVVVFISAFIGSLILKIGMKEYGGYMKQAAKKVAPALVTMCSLLIVSNIMKETGMISILANTAADIAGNFYPAAAVVIGSLGAFITGTGLGSNIMFSPMHLEATQALALNAKVVFASQNAGAALGNLICPNNVVAVATTVGEQNHEGKVMKKVFLPFFIIIALYIILSIVYSQFLFIK